MKRFVLKLLKWLGAGIAVLIISLLALWLWFAWQLPPLQTILEAPIPACAETTLPTDATTKYESWHVDALYAVEPSHSYATRLLVWASVPHDRTNSYLVKTLVLHSIVKARLNRTEIAKVILDRSYLGKGAYGLGCAAATRYGKRVSHLSLAQFAMLIGLIRGPTDYDPDHHPDRALKRRNDVLDIWLANGIATKQQVDAAKLEPL